MLNIDKMNTVYLACGATDFRRSIDGLALVVQAELKLNPFDKALFVFCNKQMNKLKILHFDEGSEDFYTKRYETRLEKSAPIIEDFIKYVDVELKNALPKSPLGGALEYTQNLLPSFRTFLTDGPLEIDNNASERAIKAFVIDRKNWILQNTSKGASSSATIYNIIETAKANDLAVEKYLVYLMDVLSNLEDKDKNRNTLHVINA